MRVFALTTLTMIAFASNSLLNRAAVEAGHADATAFALVRVIAGLLLLGFLVRMRSARLEVTSAARWVGGVALAGYMIGFSMAYISLNAGAGALIMFGTVQIVLFAHTAWSGSPLGRAQIAGALVAFAGLMLVLWPEPGSTGSLFGAVSMVIAAVGWSAYTLAGRGAADPVAATGSHFLLCLPFMLVLPFVADLQMNMSGLVLAVVCGAVTSGLGYALWYSVLPHLPGAKAAIVQLSVPVIAMALGGLFLGEVVTLKLLVSSVLVLGGIAIAILR